jgi:peptidoglycan hydrolase-like protein with peptidoglycan-binding domain
MALALTAAGSAPADAQRASSLTNGEFQVAYHIKKKKRRRYVRRRKAPKKPVGPPSWYTKEESKDPVHIIVSLPKQQMTVYKGDKVLTTSKVSSGKPGYSTPSGVFSILERKPRHYSNIYRGAPMPFMQRLTWSGIALHASGSVPNRPASHGCIRLPPSFAKQLFQVTQKGGHVVVANEDNIAPVEVVHDALFQPTPMTQEEFYEAEASRIAKLAGIEFEGNVGSKKPVRVLITRRTGRNQFVEMQKMLNELSFGAGDEDGYMGPDTSQAIRRFQATYGLPKTGIKSDELMDRLYEVSGKGKPLNGHLYVRQNFNPVFDVPIFIKEEEKPLGSHMFTAMHFEPGDDQTRWLGVTLTRGSGNKKRYGRKSRRNKKKLKDDIVLTEKAPLPSTAEEALNRVEIPDDVRKRINKMLKPGSSFAITNDGISRETTPKGTDFIVLMQ